MPPQLGEELALSAFSDAHYYMNAPGMIPQHDRFVRRVYLYVFYNTTSGQARLELANEPGTQYQDAVTGPLESTSLSYSECQANLFAFKVGEDATSTNSIAHRDSTSWQILCHDIRRESYRSHRVQAIDLYLWSVEDCVKLLSLCKQSMAQQRLHLNGDHSSASATPESCTEPAHPVVQRLERAAIAEDSRSPRFEVTNAGAASLRPRSTEDSHTNQQDSAIHPQPPAYNPAAPGRPEVIAERQKTPPPIDASAGNGLRAATLPDHVVASPPGFASSFGSMLGPTSPSSGSISSFTIGVGQKELPRLPYGPTIFPSNVPPPPRLPSSGPLPSPAVRHDSILTSDCGPIAVNPPPAYVGKAIDPAVESLHAAMNPPSEFVRAAMDPPPEFIHAAMNSPSALMQAAVNLPPDYASAPVDPHAYSQHSAIHHRFYHATPEELEHGHGGAHKSLSQAMGFGSGAPKGADHHQPAHYGDTPKKIEAKISRFDKTVNKWIKKMEKI